MHRQHFSKSLTNIQLRKRRQTPPSLITDIKLAFYHLFSISKHDEIYISKYYLLQLFIQYSYSIYNIRYIIHIYTSTFSRMLIKTVMYLKLPTYPNLLVYTQKREDLFRPSLHFFYTPDTYSGVDFLHKIFIRK